MNRPLLIKHLRSQFAMHWRGVHGAPHWARVKAMGLRLARITGADPLVVELFAWLHDSQRVSDVGDPGHGGRAADLAAELQGNLYHLTPTQLASLIEALRYHSDGFTEGNITVQTCWDADRLDLGRVGITPDPEQLCTPVAQSQAVRALAIGRTNRCLRRG